jgi:hypothetical protein
MGQLTDLHVRLATLLAEIQAAAGGTNAVRIYDSPPNQPPETPCIFEITPDEDYETMDTVQGRSIVTATLRLVIDPGRPQTDLLALADVVIETADVWLRTQHPSPLDQARRTTMRGVTPVYNEISYRGADFAVRCELEFRQTTPAL